MASDDSDDNHGSEHEEEGQEEAGVEEEEPPESTVERQDSVDSLDDDHSSVDKESHQPTEEEILHLEAATWLQRTVRGHIARRRALFTPIWVLYPMPVRRSTWGYQSFLKNVDIESVKENYNFQEMISLLDQVLEGGLGALPHLHKIELSRPMVHRRTRASYLKELVEFCVEIGAAYSRWGRAGQAEFMCQSVETLCTMPPCEDTNASRTMDACNFKGKMCYLVYVQDQLALMHYKRGDYLGALELLNKALDACGQRSIGRLPYYVLQSHKAVVLSAMGKHEAAYDIVKDYVSSLHTATENPLGDLELIETEKIVSHVMVISFHNLAVQLSNLNRFKEATEMTSHVLSLVDSGMHAAQPISRHFVYAHSASLRITKSSKPLRSYSLVTIDTEEENRGEKSWKNMSLKSSMDADTWSMNSSKMDNRNQGQWNKWLSIAGRGRAIAPVLIRLPSPQVDDLASLTDAPRGGFRDYQKVLDLAAQQFPKLDGMETCPEEVLGTVSRAIVHFVEEGLYSNSETAAAERYEQIEKLLDEDLFEHCRQLRWDVQVYGIMAKAFFFYERLEDFETCAKHAQRALDVANEQEGSGYHVAVCTLCIGACLLKAGQHDDAFSLGKTTLAYCHGLSDLDLQDPAVRVQMEDILVGASHLMALAHIFLGNGKVALKLSKIAKEHIKNTSYYGNKSTIQYTQVTRVCEIAMSMNELQADKSTFQSNPKRGSLYVEKASRLNPTKFVPCALQRNLPELYPDKFQMRGESRSVMRQTRSAIAPDPPGETLIQRVINEEPVVKVGVENPELANDEMKKLKPVGSKRYKWTGRYSTELNAAAVESEQIDTSAIASVSMTAPLANHSMSYDSLSSYSNAGKTGPSGMPPLSVHSGNVSPPIHGRIKTASTPYGRLKTSGMSPIPDPSTTGHQWVDDLALNKQKTRERFASDPSSNFYFAKVYKMAKDQNSLLMDPLAKVVPQRRFVVGDHLRPQVGGPRVPDSKSSKKNDKPPHLLRDWGPDPTFELRQYSRSTSGMRLSVSTIPARSHTALGLVSDVQDKSITGDDLHQEERESLKLDMNEIRVMKHLPYDSVVRRSTMGLFVSRGERHALVNEVDEFCSRKNTQPVTGANWSEAERLDRNVKTVSTMRTSKSSVSRPWYWSHAPEPSPYIHAEKGERFASNRHYRALPHGQNLSPAAKQAYGTNGAVAFGERSLQTVEVEQRSIVSSANLSRKPMLSSNGARSLGSFD